MRTSFRVALQRILCKAKHLSGGTLSSFVLSSALPTHPALVKDIWLGLGDACAAELTNVNGALFFVASDAGHGAALPGTQPRVDLYQTDSVCSPSSTANYYCPCISFPALLTP